MCIFDLLNVFSSSIHIIISHRIKQIVKECSFFHYVIIFVGDFWQPFWIPFGLIRWHASIFIFPINRSIDKNERWEETYLVRMYVLLILWLLFYHIIILNTWALTFWLSQQVVWFSIVTVCCWRCYWFCCQARCLSCYRHWIC